ncbi:MAG: zinc dependent phospholipase C family protein [Flavobacteriales bacterium]
MRQITRKSTILFTSVLVVCLFTAFIPDTHTCQHATWGFFGHKKINELAIYTLPEEMFGFYKAHMDYLIEHSVDPDKRRYGVVGEAECHYIDMDRYADSLHPNPFDNVPRRWIDAVAKYSEDSLRAHGIVPWNIYNVEQKLTEAFRKKDVLRILRLSAEIGHYIGDAHVPLHTTSNYNGQKTNQRGIHGFWESRLPELYSTDYDFFVGKANYIKAPLNYIWERIGESYACVDSVLGFEQSLNGSFANDRKYSYESRGNTSMKVYSEEYSRAYSEMLDGQVERRMQSAVLTVGSFWYTAWADAGSPDLLPFVNINLQELADTSQISVGQDNIKVRDHE